MILNICTWEISIFPQHYNQAKGLVRAKQTLFHRNLWNSFLISKMFVAFAGPNRTLSVHEKHNL